MFVTEEFLGGVEFKLLIKFKVSIKYLAHATNTSMSRQNDTHCFNRINKSDQSKKFKYELFQVT